MEDLHFLFGMFGNAAGLFLFLSPIPTFLRIIKNKTTEEFSGIPYNLTLLNCLLATWYGLPFVSPNNLLVVTINGLGIVIQSIYVVIFLVFAPKKVRVKMLGLLAIVLTLFAAVALVSILALHGNNRALFCDCAATVVTICMYASPLSVMGVVIRTKSVEFMPFLLSLFVFFSGTSWFVYGILGRDIFLALRNGIGTALGVVQLILYAIYRDNYQITPLEEKKLGNAKPQQPNSQGVLNC